MTTVLRIALLATVCVWAATATPIPGLVSTGGATPGSQDPTWQWSFNPTPPAGVFVPAYVTDDTSYPFPHWVANSAQSKWISPQPGYGTAYGNYADDVGYHYFAIGYYIDSSYNPDSATFQFMMATDNQVAGVWINSTLLSGINTYGYTSLQGPYTVGPTPGLFHTGWNSMVVVIYNAALPNPPVPTDPYSWNPVGVRVEILSSNIEGGPVGEIPEPGVLYLCGAGLLSIGLLRLRQKA